MLDSLHLMKHRKHKGTANRAVVIDDVAGFFSSFLQAFKNKSIMSKEEDVLVQLLVIDNEL